MRYHNITKEDMLNGSGLRVVLWLSGCTHMCRNCQNPVTWNPDCGLIFGEKEKEEIYEELKKAWVAGITFSGGDPLHERNRKEVRDLIKEIRKDFPDKNIWLYSGYMWEETRKDPSLSEVVDAVDVFVDGPFIEELKEFDYKWAGSTNQRVINIKESLAGGTIVLQK